MDSKSSRSTRRRRKAATCRNRRALDSAEKDFDRRWALTLLDRALALVAGAVAVAVHRLRVRYREIVHAGIAQTVASEAELKAEMSHLFSILD